MAKYRGHGNGKKGQLATEVKEMYRQEKPDMYIMVKVTYNLKTKSFTPKA